MTLTRLSIFEDLHIGWTSHSMKGFIKWIENTNRGAPRGLQSSAGCKVAADPRKNGQYHSSAASL